MNFSHSIRIFFIVEHSCKVRLCEGEGCGNPCSLKCPHFMCRQCCRFASSLNRLVLCVATITTSIFRAKCRAEILDCPTHKMFKKTLTERAKQKEEEGKQGVEGDRGGGEQEVVAEA